jgi:acetolactate synthase-1/2/3 large subunit
MSPGARSVNGARALLETLKASGVEVCFANPGTSEMQLVAALDEVDGIRAVLGLFEGVVTGAADGYGRMADKPAVTLLHLGPGLANGLANLHNARRGGSPIVNLVGDHADYHLYLNSPLTSDIEGLARPVSDWVYRATSADDLAEAGAAAVAIAHEGAGRIATMIVPANHAWSGDAISAPPRPTDAPATVAPDVIERAARALRSARMPCLFIGGRALREDAMLAAGRVATATGARIVCETFATRHQRGAGRVAVEKLPYFGEEAQAFLAKFDAIVYCGADAPMSFFAYPEKPSILAPDTALSVRLASKRQNHLHALSALADALGAPAETDRLQRAGTSPVEEGKLTPVNAGAIIAEMLPDDAIVSDEGATSSFAAFAQSAGAARHDWLQLTGGAIGQGLPVAVGAAIACPNRKVIALQADGSAMYTNQALWTMARERLDIVTILFNNRSYAILNIEMTRVGAQTPGPKAKAMLNLREPDIQWRTLAESMGVEATTVTTTEEFRASLGRALARKGPVLIEAMI